MEILAEKREKLGKQSKKLLVDRKMPAVVYGSGLESTSLTIDINTFSKIYRQAGETGLIDLKFGDSSEKVLVREVQLHPVTLLPTHASFFKVNLKEKTSANIPVEVIGEEISPVVKSGEGLVLLLMNEIEVEALPMNLPHSFVVDVSGLKEIGAGLKVMDLEFDREKVELVNAEEEDLVVKIDHAEMEEEPEEELTEAELIEGVEATEETTEEGEEGEDGEAAPGEGEKKQPEGDKSEEPQE